MKKSIIKVFSVILVVVLTLTSAPLSGFVGIELPEWLDFSIMSKAATTSGECGENVYWSYNATTYTLTISGTGDMNNYSDFYHISPWESYEDSIKKVVINKGVKSIGECAFYSCSSLTSVTIGDGVTSIDSCAFEYCTALTSLTIPNSVTFIGETVFKDCKSLKSVYISDISAWCNITFYGTVSNPLYNGANLYLNGAMVTDLVIPHDVTKLNDYVFYNCKSITHVAIGDNVTSIGEYAFYNCTSLTSVIIGDSVTSIGNYAFYNCKSIISVTIPDSVTSIDSYAFYNCTGLTSVTIGDSVTSIGYNAFYNCTSLKLVYISDISAWCNITFNNASSNPLNSGASLYLNGTKVTDLVIPDDVTKLNDYVFYNYDSVASITIPKSVTAIGEIAFVGCTNLTSITVDSNNQYFISNEDDVLFNKDKTALIQYPIGNTRTSYTIPDSVTSIDSCAFAYCTSLKNVTIPDSVTSIGDSTFSDCTSLTSVTIGDSVTSIGEMAFRDCTRLTSIIIPDSVTSIGEAAFRDCKSLASIIIQNNVTIGYYAFGGCTKLASITIGNGVMISDDAFSSTAYYNDTNNWENNVLYIGNYLIEANSNISGDYIVKSGTCAIADKAFYERKNLTSITIPNSVISIGSYAFYYCDSLERVSMGNRVASIGTQAFYYCTALTGVYITNLTNWCSIDFCSSSSNPLYYANSLYINGKLAIDIVIPNSVNKISQYAFYKCTSLKSVVIGNSVTHIGESAFDYCGEIISFTLGENIESIDDWAFAECNKLESVYITNLSAWCNIEFGHRVSNPLYYADDLYLNNQRITELVIPNDVTSINDYSFCIWKNLTSVIISDTVSFIGKDAFEFCSGLVSVTIPDTVTVISDYAFNGCNSLKYVFYSGSESDLTNISMGRANESLFNAKIHYNSYSHILTNEWIIDLEPTCTKNGSKFHRCTICDAKTDITVIPAFGHTPSGEWVIDLEPTCTKNGSKHHRCTVCSYKMDITIINALGHCFKNDVCTNCQSSIELVTNIGIIDSGILESIHNYASNTNETKTYSAIGADYINVTFSSSTFVEDDYDKIYIYDGSDNLIGTYTGSKLANKTIKVDGDTVKIRLKSDSSVNKYGYYATCEAYRESLICNNHMHKKVLNDIDADCKNNGYTGDVVCAVCDTIIEYGEIISSLGHDMITIDAAVSPDCTNTGLTEGTHCSRCDYMIEQTVVDALGHNYATEITPPTCTDRGYTTYTCSVCGDTYTSDYVDALGHTDCEIVEENYIVPTCTENGSKDNVTYCTVCGAETSRKEIIIDATGHTEEEILAVAPTCTEKGLTAGVKCSACDEILTAQQELPANGHSHDSVVTAPTCTEQGYTTYTCACGDSYVDDYTDSLDHDFENGTCTECGATDPDYFTFEIQNPSRTTIRCNDGIKLHASVTGILPKGSRIEWSKNNSNFNVNVSDSGNEITIISKNNGYTTFTATVYDADNKVISEDTIEIYSKASFFDKIGGFFRSIFGMTKIYEN